MTGIMPSLTERGSVKWFKSSYSGGEGNECVEVAVHGSCVGMRDSKSPRETLAFSAHAFTAFVKSLPAAQRGAFRP